MKYRKYKIFLALIDILLIFITLKYSFWMVSYLRRIDYLVPAPDVHVVILLLSLSILTIFKILGLYKMHILLDAYYQFVVIIKSVLISFGILLAVLFILKHPVLMLRREIVLSFFALCALFVLLRILIVRVSLRYALKNKLIGARVILIGAGSKGCEIAKELTTNKYSYFDPIGFLDDYKKAGETIGGTEVLDKIENINKYSGRFDEILIAMTNISYNRLQTIIDICRRLRKPIHVVSDLYRIIPEKLKVERFSGFSTFQIPPTNGFSKNLYIILKRLIDYTVTLSFILLLFPFWLIIGILIKKGSKGPVLYKTDVIGYKGEKFKWYKFRTMYINTDDSIHRELFRQYAEGSRDGQKLQDDPRITPIGSWLRKFSIDEFPQLLNVLKGQMSLVGPRPVLPYEYELLDDWQKERFTVLPGMTGLWQIIGRNKVNFADQHVLDLYYVRNRSITLDLEILFGTFSVVISGRTGS